MIVEGDHRFANASRERVFAALDDPGVLARSLPGCRELAEVEEGAYNLVIDAGVGSIRGAYSGRVSVDERVPPERFAATLQAEGSSGSVRARLSASLDAGDGGTALAYRVDAELTGAIAGVGQRVAAGVARRNAAQFFAALERELDGSSAGEPERPVTVHPGGAPTDATGSRWLERGIVLGCLATAAGVVLGARIERRRGRR